MASRKAFVNQLWKENINACVQDQWIDNMIRESPWQNPYVERFIGSIRRECLDHVIIITVAGLRRILKEYFEYYERSRTHLSLEKDAPISRSVQPPSCGHVVEIPVVGGLHHRYERRAA